MAADMLHFLFSYCGTEGGASLVERKADQLAIAFDFTPSGCVGTMHNSLDEKLQFLATFRNRFKTSTLRSLCQSTFPTKSPRTN